MTIMVHVVAASSWSSWALLGALGGIALGLAMVGLAMGGPADQCGGRDPINQPADRVPARWFRGLGGRRRAHRPAHTQSVEHPGKAKTKADRNGKRSRHREDKESGDHADGEIGKGNGKDSSRRAATMSLGVSLFLLAVGPVLTFAVEVTTSGFSLHTVGIILMVAGALGLVLSLLF